MANIIGELLAREGLISETQLVQALACQQRERCRLGDILVSLGFLTANQLDQFLQPVPPVPLKVVDTGLSETFLIDLLLKAAHQETGTFTLHQISDTISLPFSVVDELAEVAKADQLVSIRSATSYTRATQILELTKRGWKEWKRRLVPAVMWGRLRCHCWTIHAP